MTHTGILAFIGTYTRSQSRGIYSVRLDPSTGALSEPAVAAETTNPTFLALSPDRRLLYAVRDSEAVAAAFAVDPSGSLKPLPAAPSPTAVAPCHVSVDRTRRVLLATNYHTGFVAALPILPDGTLGPPRRIQHRGQGVHPVRQTSPHPHSVTISPDNRFALVCDLGLDRIYTYRVDPERAELAPPDAPFTPVAAGSGPRHLTFAAGGRRVYLVTEMGNTVVGFDYRDADGTLSAFQTVSTLPPGWTGTSIAAEVRVHPNGRHLYASNRGHDSIAHFEVEPESGRLSFVDAVGCGGKGPRHFALTPDGGWLLCANQQTDNLASFRVDPGSGRLTPAGSAGGVPMPVCVLFFP
jgi:6-phosphogluconolactonase